MKEISCDYCQKPITSKEDFVLGTHYTTTPSPYHIQCFNEAKTKLSFFRKPVMKYSPKSFNFGLIMNIINIIFGAALIIFANEMNFLIPPFVAILYGLFAIIVGVIFGRVFLKYKNLF
jgi:hypothetical protein